ncbi:MAG: MoaD/ThiS family protein [Planctomycetota bacterium]
MSHPAGATRPGSLPFKKFKPTMQITIQLFGMQARLADARVIQLDLPEDADCQAALDRLAVDYPALTDSLPGSRLAVNQHYAEPDRRLAPGDEVALIGMISGG